MKMSIFRLVNESILKEIDRKKKMLESVPDYHIHYSNGRKKNIQKEANKHSVSLELEMYDTNTSKGRKLKAREQNYCEKNLEIALNWALENYTGEITDDFIKKVGEKIDPRSNSRGYRSDRVIVVGAQWSPPSPEKVEREMRYFAFENSCLENSIEKAIHAHFNLARIHPFSDGNGRTARLLQNIMLEHFGFLPATIRVSDRIEYLHLIDSAVASYKVAEGSFGEIEEYAYRELLRNLSEGLCSDKQQHFCRSTALKILNAKTTTEQHDFYNFIAFKIRDEFQQVWERIYHERKANYLSKRKE